MSSGLSNAKTAALWVAALAGYLQAVEWISLFPWNDIRRGNGQETLDLLLGAGSAVLVIWLWVGGRVAAAAASLALAVWAFLQISTWWVPYFFGASDGWRRVHERWFSQTVQVLPRSADNLPPDANHLVLHVLIVIALAFSVRAALTGDRCAQ